MSEYYQGHDVIIRFDVLKDGDEVSPSQAVVSVYDEDKKFIVQDTARVEGNEVSYLLNGDKVEKAGGYVFVFEVTIRGLGDYTHVVNIEVSEAPEEVQHADTR